MLEKLRQEKWSKKGKAKKSNLSLVNAHCPKVQEWISVKKNLSTYKKIDTDYHTHGDSHVLVNMLYG